MDMLEAAQIPATRFDDAGILISVAAVALAIVLVMIFTRKKK